MKYINLLLIALLTSLTGCQTVKENTTEPKARDAAKWVRNQSGLIQSAVMTITHVAVYSAEKDSYDRARTLEIMKSVAGNLNAIISTGKFDPNEIQQALRIDEPYFGPLFASIGLLIHTESLKFSENGYSELTLEILKAVTAGIRDGCVE